MSPLDIFLMGFFVGGLSTGFYFFHTIKYLKKKGYIVYEVTEKFKKEVEDGKKKIS